MVGRQDVVRNPQLPWVDRAKQGITCELPSVSMYSTRLQLLQRSNQHHSNATMICAASKSVVLCRGLDLRETDLLH